MSLSAFSSLIDPRLGLIRGVEPLPLHPNLPAGLRAARASIADSRAYSPWASDAASAGFAWWDEEAAFAAAAGEAVERTCGNLIPPGLRRASWSELAAAGEAAVDPESLALFSAGQHAQRGFPFVRFTRDLPVLWAEGRDLVTGGRVLVPASLTWVTFFTGEPTRAEPRTHFTNYAGIAAGPTPEAAELSALEEVLERDAVTLGWISGAPLPRLVPPRSMAPLLAGARGTLDTRLYLFPSAAGAPVVGALMWDRETGRLGMGTACRADPARAAWKAVAEAAQIQEICRALDDPEDSGRRRATEVPGAAVKPWRADRAYRRDYRADWRDVRDLLCQLQLYLDPEMRAPLEERLAGGPEIPLADVPALAGGRDEIVRRLAARGCAPVAVDLTTPDVARAGLAVARVVAPGLYGNTPAAFPYLGGDRLAAALEGRKPCLLPLPYG